MLVRLLSAPRASRRPRPRRPPTRTFGCSATSSSHLSGIRGYTRQSGGRAATQRPPTGAQSRSRRRSSRICATPQSGDTWPVPTKRQKLHRRRHGNPQQWQTPARRAGSKLRVSAHSLQGVTLSVRQTQQRQLRAAKAAGSPRRRRCSRGGRPPAQTPPGGVGCDRLAARAFALDRLAQPGRAEHHRARPIGRPRRAAVLHLVDAVGRRQTYLRAVLAQFGYGKTPGERMTDARRRALAARAQ